MFELRSGYIWMSVHDIYGGFGVFDWVASMFHQGMIVISFQILFYT